MRVSAVARSSTVLFTSSGRRRTATDSSPTEAVLLEVLEDLGLQPDLVVMLQATSPLRQPSDIDGAIRKLQLDGADSLFSARRVEGFTWRDAFGDALNPNYITRSMRQTRRICTLEENGSIYVFKPTVLRRYNQRLGGNIASYLMHPLDSFQIDEPQDVALLESLMELRLSACDKANAS